MKVFKITAVCVFAISCLVYIVVKTTTYSISYDNYNLQEEVNELSTENDELQIQLTTNLSRTELMEKYPNLTLHDNIFYMEDEK